MAGKSLPSNLRGQDVALHAPSRSSRPSFIESLYVTRSHPPPEEPHPLPRTFSIPSESMLDQSVPRYPNLLPQQAACPLSQDQLAAEVKGIYAGLVMVESKCINSDAPHMDKPSSELTSYQWQALVALHRALLYEHHDFFMATQHPSANEPLRGLAAKYCMPARMWKHGIHAFLEVLRHRRPESQDFMRNFIYLAYQMMALLIETVPSSADVWIECLGDLARYRMAIEGEKEPRGIWGTIAARWYTIASDRHPVGGRMYHHLGVLERPTRTLTYMPSFPNARDSCAALCAPICQDEGLIRRGSRDQESFVVSLRSVIFDSQTSAIERVHADALASMRTHYAKLRDGAGYLTHTNISALFDLGRVSGQLRQMYSHALNNVWQSLSAVPLCGSTLQDKLGDKISCRLRTLIPTSFPAHVGNDEIQRCLSAIIPERVGCFDDVDGDTSMDLACTPSVSSETVEWPDLSPSLFISPTPGTIVSSSNASRPRRILRCLVSEYSGSSQSIYPLASFAVTFALFGRTFASRGVPDPPPGRPQLNGNPDTLVDIINISCSILPVAVSAVGVINALWIFRSRGSRGSMPPRRCRCQSSFTSMLSLVLSLAFWVIAETATEMNSHNQQMVNFTFSLWFAFWLSYLALNSKKVSDNMTFLWATLVMTVITAFSYAAYVSDYRGDEGGRSNPVRDIVMRAIRFSPVCATGSSMLFAKFLSYRQGSDNTVLELETQTRRHGQEFSAR